MPWGTRPLPHPPMGGATLQSSGYASDAPPYASIPIDQHGVCPQSQMVSSQPCMHHYMTAGGMLTLPGVHHDRHQCLNAVNRPAHTLPPTAHSYPLSTLSPPNGKVSTVSDAVPSALCQLVSLSRVQGLIPGFSKMTSELFITKRSVCLHQGVKYRRKTRAAVSTGFPSTPTWMRRFPTCPTIA